MRWFLRPASFSAVVRRASFLHAQGRGQASPASVPPPRSATPQAYPADQIQAGQRIFSAQCGFCHGRDAMGGESGPDLTRAAIVAEDVRGDKLGPLLRAGRVDKGMPAFALSASDLGAVVAFVHDQKTKAESLTGGRRTVDLADLQTGDPEAGRRYFAAPCASCHSPTGDLAGVATRLRGLPLLQRMLYPAPGRDGSKATVTVTLASGQVDHRPTRLPRRVHDRAHRFERLVSSMAGEAGEVRRQRSAAGPCRSARQVHRWGHA